MAWVRLLIFLEIRFVLKTVFDEDQGAEVRHSAAGVL
jgi:hypothetical protein